MKSSETAPNKGFSAICSPNPFITTGRLNTYLADINEQATERMLLLTEQMAEREGVTEQLKAQDQMLWVQRMNNIRDRAMEIVNHELIYA